MAKSKGKKSKNNGPPVNPPNVSKKIEKKSSKKKKKVNKINKAFALDIGPSSTSTPSTTIIASSNATLNASNKGEKKNKEKEERVFGFIFMCNGMTKPQCYQYRVFGLPKGRKEEVAKIKVGSKLFLFDFDLKLLYGIYEASSNGQMNLEQDTFNGKFPAQVRFKIWKDCLPLSEGAFKNAIRDNYEGSKFRPELTRKQVKALISLFRPINLPLPTSVAPLVSNVAPLHSFPAPLVEERFHPPARLTPLEDPYLPGVQRTHGPLVLHPHSAQVVSSSLYDHYGATAPLSSMYDHYEAAPSVARVQPSIEEPHVVRQTTFPHHTDPYYFAEAPQTYLTKKPVSSTQYPYRRYATAPEIVPRDHPAAYESEYRRVSHLPRVDEALPPIEALVDYYSQRPPPAASSHPSLRPHALGPPYVPAPAPHALPELASSHRPYYAREEPSRAYAADPIRRPMPGRPSLAEPAPVSSFYSFAGPAPTFRYE